MWRALGPLVSWESPSEETGWDQLGRRRYKGGERVNKCMSIVPSWLGKYNQNRHRHVYGAKGRERVEY